MENNFDPMTGEPVNETKNMASEAGVPKKKMPMGVIIGGAIAVVVLLVVILVASGVFRGKAATVALAFANTFKEQPKFMEDLKVDEITKWAKDKNYTVNMLAEDDDVSINMSAGFASSEVRLSGEFEGEYMPETDFVVSYTDKLVKAQLPAMSDIIFVYNYTKMPEGDLADEIDEDDIEMINETLSTYWTQDTAKLEKKISKAVMDVVKEIEIEKIDSKEYKVDDKKRKCKGYSLVLTDDEVLDMIDAVDSVMEEELTETVYDIYADALDEVRDTMRDFPETEVEIYIYKNKLACINAIMDDEDTEIEWLFKGGDFRIQNMEITVDNGYGSETLEFEGKKDGSKEEYELSMDGEELFVFEYDSKDGDFVIEVDGEELEGNLLSERNGITLTFEIEDVEASMSILKGTDFEKMSGEEFDIGEASEDDFMDLYEDNEELFDMIEDLMYSFF